MADDLLVRVDAQVAEFQAEFGKATTSTIQLEAALKRASAQQELLQAQVTKYGKESAQAQSALARATASNARLAEKSAAVQKAAAAEQAAALEKQRAAMASLGRTGIVFGGALALGLGLSAKAAIDWESAFAGVARVVHGTPEQIDALEGSLRDLTKTLPVSHDEIANLATAAGQLGVARGDIADFVKVAVELGATTSLAAEDAVTGLARLQNILGTAPGQISNLGSALVAMGQSGASSEQEILDMGLRIAAAGKLAGFSAGDVLGFANAMSSVGIQAEAGGTALSQTLQGMSQAVSKGGKDLKGFAEVAGLSAEQFKTLFSTDAAKATEKFVVGLKEIKDSGGDVYSVLQGLGITGQRQIRTLLSMSQTTELLDKAIGGANDAFSENNALQDAAAKRFETTAAKLEIAKNDVTDFAISLGQELLPVLGHVAESVGTFTDLLGHIPGPVQEMLVILTAAAAAVTLFGGAALVARAKIAQYQLALKDAQVSTAGFTKKAFAMRGGALAIGIGLEALNSHVDSSNTGLKTLTSTAADAAIGFSIGGPWGAAIGGGIGLLGALTKAGHSATDGLIDLNKEVETILATLSKTGGVTRDSLVPIAEAIQAVGGATDAADFGIPFEQLVAAAAGSKTAIADVQATLDAAVSDAASKKNAISDALAVETDPGKIADLREQLAGATADYISTKAGADGLRDTIGGQNKVVNEAVDKWHAHSDAEKGAAGASSLMGDSTEDTGKKISATAQDVKNLTRALLANQHALSVRSSLRDFEAAIDDARKALHENGKTLDINTAKGRDNQAALDDIAASASAHAAAMKEDGRSIDAQRGFVLAARKELFASARQFGMSETAAHNYVNEVLKIPKKALTEVQLDDRQARRDAQALKNYIESLPVTMTVRERHVAATLGIPNATGGYISGPGTGTSDSIPARLSDGEYVVRASAVRRIGVGNLDAMNALGYAGGGRAGAPMSMADLMRIISRPEQSFSLGDVAKEFRDVAQAERALKAAREAEHNASKQVEATEKRLATLRGAEHKDKDQIAAVEQRLHRQRQAEKATADDLQHAEDDLSKQRNELKDTTQGLIDQTKGWMTSITDLGAAFGGAGTSVTAQGLLAKRKSVGSDAAEFRTDLGIIKRKGADSDLINELRDEGATSDALGLLRDLVRQPRSYFKELRQADQRLERNASAVATFGIGGSGGRRQRGPSGGRSLSMHDRGPLVIIEHLHARDERAAARETHRVWQQAVTLARS